jgi:hypothetical protein
VRAISSVVAFPAHPSLDPLVPRTSVHVLSLVVLCAIPFTAALSAAPGAPAAPAAAASPHQTQLKDGTRFSRWTLQNGLRVVTRNVPRARSAAITLCYRLGSREDPVGREGLAEMVAQVAFTGRSGDVPGRSMSELDQLRPGGWSIKVGPHLTELTEACPTEQLPSVFHQVSQRLRGVTVDASLLSRGREAVRRRLSQNYDTQPDKSLYFLSGEMAAGRSAQQAMRYATGDGLGDITLKDLTALLAERLVPANTVLCLVGDLSGLDLTTLVERELSAVPAGKPAPPIRWGKIVPSVAKLTRPDLQKSIGLVAVIAPALTDTMHAYFTAFSISAAGFASRTWGKPDPPLSARFQYSISTDPELIRFYPPVSGAIDADRTLSALLDQSGEGIVDSSSVQVAGESMLWLTGGPLPADLFKRALGDPTVIHTLATTLAALEAFGDDEFWTEYRARLVRAASIDLGPYFGWYNDPGRRIVLTLHPRN